MSFHSATGLVTGEPTCTMILGCGAVHGGEGVAHPGPQGRHAECPRKNPLKGADTVWCVLCSPLDPLDKADTGSQCQALAPLPPLPQLYRPGRSFEQVRAPLEKQPFPRMPQPLPSRFCRVSDQMSCAARSRPNPGHLQQAEGLGGGLWLQLLFLLPWVLRDPAECTARFSSLSPV